MPIVGTREARTPGASYAKDPMRAYAKEFLDITSSMLNEQMLDPYTELPKVYHNPITDGAMKNFFIENSFDRTDPSYSDSEEAYADHLEMMEELYQNDKEGMLSAFQEHAAMMQYNPVVGLTFPIHKNIMLNNIFDKGAIPKYVATSPKFTVSMETRWLVDPETGEKIDMWREQWKMTDAILKAAPLKSMYMPLPETEQTNVLQTLFGVSDPEDHLSIESYISGLVGSRVIFPDQTIQVTTSLTDATTGEITYHVRKYTNTTASAEVASAGATLAGTFEDPDYDATEVVIGGCFDFNGKFAPAYGGYDRQIVEQYAVPAVDSVAPGTLTGTWKLTVGTNVFDNMTSEEGIPGKFRTVGFLSGFTKNDRFGLQSSNTGVQGCILTSRIDTSSAKIKTASVSWDVRTDIIEIPNAIPINVTISPEEVKDISALYQINQLTKVMSLIKTSLGNYKDDLLRRGLDKSYVDMPNDCKIGRYFDFAPTLNYALDPLEWRYKMFMDALDTHVTQLLHVLNDPNMTFNIIGRDDLIRKITPVEYTYQTPSAIGPVELDFVKTVVTSDKRTYQFISSDKLRDTNNLMILLCPRNTERFIYRIYDYQMYLSNEIRNHGNSSLPAVHAFERWKLEEYQPVQGRIGILNPTGLRNYGANYAFNNDPVGRGDGQGVASVGKNDFDIDAR